VSAASLGSRRGLPGWGGLRPYFGRDTTISTTLGRPDALRRLAVVVSGSPLHGAVRGTTFWVRGGEGLARWHPYGTGEVDEAASGCRVRVHLGMHPLAYLVEVAAVAVVLLWTATAAMGELLHQAGILPEGVAWRPYAGVAALVLLVLGIVQLHRLAGRQRANLLDRLRTALEE
jgi:hypothetical protein